MRPIFRFRQVSDSPRRYLSEKQLNTDRIKCIDLCRVSSIGIFILEITRLRQNKKMFENVP